MTPEKRKLVLTRCRLRILLQSVLLSLLATAPSGSLSAQSIRSSTDAEVQNRLTIIQNAMKANAIQIHSDDTLRMIAEDPTCVFAPFGPEMPPATIAIAMSADRNPRTYLFKNYPGTYRAMRASNTDLSIDLMINSRSDDVYSIFPPKAYSTSIRRVIDGGLTPIGGQIYRWDGKELTLTRVDGHPLAREPKDSVGVFHLPITATTLTFGFSSSLGGMLLLDPQELRRGNPLIYEPDGVLLQIYPGPSEDGGTIYGPTPLSGARPACVRVGESIESPNWRVKVLRIVFPDKEAKLDGWVDLRVKYSTAASERPPAPYLPIDPEVDDTQVDRDNDLFRILWRTMLLSVLASAPSGSLPAQLMSAPTESEVQNRLFIIESAMKAIGIQIHADDIVRMLVEHPICLLPSFGPGMPPARITLEMSSARNSRTRLFQNHPGTYRALHISNSDFSIDLMPNSGLYGNINTIWTPTAFFSSIRRVVDGGLTPIRGQVYRWDGKASTLTRVDDHALAREPKDSIGVFHLPITESPPQFGFVSSLHGRLWLMAHELRAGDPEKNEPDRVLLQVHAGPRERGETVQGPPRFPGPPPTWVRVGESIEARNWKVNVLRVVFPDSDEKLDGWVDLRVEYNASASE
jgi:hypothetical protein